MAEACGGESRCGGGRFHKPNANTFVDRLHPRSISTSRSPRQIGQNDHRLNAKAKGPDRVMVITDAMCAAGEPDGFLNSSHSVSQNRVMLSWPFWYNGTVMKTENDTRYKWVMLALLAFTYFLMHATRQIFNASLPDIKLSLPGTSDAQWGFTRTAFLFAYGLAVPLAGIVASSILAS